MANTNRNPLVGAAALTGTSSVLRRGLISTIGSLALTGTSSLPVLGTVRTPTVGSLTLTGTSSVLALALTPTVGSLTLSPQPMIYGPAAYTQQGTLFFGDWTDTAIQPAVGALVGTGVAPLLNRSLVSTVGTLTVSGVAPTLGHAVLAAVGALALTPIAPTLDRAIVSTVGSLTLTGVEAFASVRSSPGTGSLSLAGGTPSSLITTGATPSTGALIFSGTNSVLNLVSGPAVGALTLTTAAPSIAGIRPGTGALILTSGAAFDATNPITPSTGALWFGDPNEVRTAALVLTGYAPSLAVGIAPIPGALFFGLSQDVLATPGVATLTLTGIQARPNPPNDTAITPSTGILVLYRSPSPTGATLALTGYAPLMPITRTPLVATLTWTAQVAVVSDGPPRFLTPACGALTLAGQGALFLGRMAPSTGSLALTGGLAFTGGVSVPTSVAQEGCGSVFEVEEEGCGTTTSPALETVTAATALVGQFV